MEAHITRAPVVLVIEPDRDRARQIYRSLRRVRVSRPYGVQSADHAREWLTEVWPDLCVLANAELAAELRDDLSDVPFVILSSTDAELEFPLEHPGGVDVIPAGDGAIEALAVRARQMLMWVEARLVSENVSFQLSRTTSQLKLPYPQRLRAIGRQLDRERAAAVDLLEVPGGFVARVHGDADDDVQIRDYREGDIPWLLEQAEASRNEPAWRRSTGPLRPEGHEATLRVIGQELDRLETGAVTISDLGSRLLVRSVSVKDGPISLSYTPDAIETLMHEYAKQRSE